jgi:Fe-S cluster assembly iron-binding protein IscA
MLEVTDRAATALRDVLAANDAESEQAIRITAEESGGLGMAIDEPREGDVVVRQDEQPVLVVATDVADLLDHARLDFGSTPDDPSGQPAFQLQSQDEAQA